MPKTRTGEKISWNEFFKRWKEGIENLSIEQKLSNELRGTFITLIGYLVSLIAVIIMREKIGFLSYGLILIFIGSIWNTGVKFLSIRQQFTFLSKLEKEVYDV